MIKILDFQEIRCYQYSMKKTALPETRARLTAVVGTAGDVVTIDDTVRMLDLSRTQAAKLLSRWTAQGWLRRVGTGAYAPVQLDMLGADQVVQDPWVLVPVLFGPAYIGGRTVATFGFLEITIARALFLLTGTAEQERELTEEDFQAWTKQMQNALAGSIGRLVPKLQTAFRKDSRISREDEDDVICRLEQLKQWRDIPCHAAWVEFNTEGEGRPLFVNWKSEITDSFCPEIL